MLFNSIEFALFLPLVFLLYWFVAQKNLKVQNTLLLLASYVFYGWWDWRFLSLIAFSSLLDYTIGRRLYAATSHTVKRRFLGLSIGINLGFLGVFKYFNFFVDSFSQAFTFFGQSIDIGRLDIILPVGISFYTFQTLSYTLDIYKGKLEPAKDPIAFFAFVSFFPQLVAGPIERATNLLPQFYKKRQFDYGQASDGMRQILWGFFKKIVIADNCAYYANQIFDNYGDMNGSTLLLGAVFFTFQIYGDFSGYSDIAIGTSRLFGFRLMQNFAFPYFSRDIAEFWRRWHISLSTWFRDYVYIPLGGSRGNTRSQIRNVFIIFLVSGFWHGANWTFIFWGFLNALYFLPLLLSDKNRSNLGTVAEGKFIPTVRELLQMSATFLLTVLAWVFFRAESISHAWLYLEGICDLSLFSIPKEDIRIISNRYDLLYTVALVILFVLIEWLHRTKQHGLQIEYLPAVARRLVYMVLIGILFWFQADQQAFIYFQF